jgi:hypothetical protein
MCRASQAAEKLVRVVGRGFIPGIKPIKSTWASQAAEKLDKSAIHGTVLKGHDFNRAINTLK